MPSFCESANASDTTALTKAIYLNAYASTPPFTCLPSDVSTIISADGTVNRSALEGHVASLITSKANPPQPANIESSARDPDVANPTKDFADKAATLRTNIQKEYCWYYRRYDWAMQKILMNVASNTGEVDASLKNGAITLNTKLNVILLIMKGIVNNRLSSLNTYYNGASGTGQINAINMELDDTRTNLVNHSRKLQNNDLKSDVQSAMIEYSLEKNSSSRNLLAIYGFMNIIAAGLLFYIYTKSKA
jgi:hypothetical protein